MSPGSSVTHWLRWSRLELRSNMNKTMKGRDERMGRHGRRSEGCAEGMIILTVLVGSWGILTPVNLLGLTSKSSSSYAAPFGAEGQSA
eukprot:302077-Rhodomonas_salina.3